MKLPIFQVDAFSSKIFSGNPAAVIPVVATSFFFSAILYTRWKLQTLFYPHSNWDSTVVLETIPAVLSCL